MSIRYSKNKLIKQSIEAITKYKLTEICDLCAYLPCSRATFYNYQMDKLDDIKDLIEENKIKIKNGLKKKWFDSNNATTQIALYKLLGTREERLALSNCEKENTDTKQDNKIVIVRKVIKSKEDLKKGTGNNEKQD